MTDQINQLGIDRCAEILNVSAYTIRRAARGIIKLTPVELRKLNETIYGPPEPETTPAGLHQLRVGDYKNSPRHVNCRTCGLKFKKTTNSNTLTCPDCVTSERAKTLIRGGRK